jgi:hypothetical protein
MATKQGDIGLLNEPIAQDLLQSTIPARFAYVWHDGTPRVIPVCFHWNGTHIVVGTPLTAPKMKALVKNPKVALTIDTDTYPYRVLQIRGTAAIETVDGLVPEYTQAVKRYLGNDQGQAWIEQVKKLFPRMARISVTPQWVSIIDFETRFPSAIEAAISQQR